MSPWKWEVEFRSFFDIAYLDCYLALVDGQQLHGVWLCVCVCVCVCDELDRNVECFWHMSLNYPGVLLTERKEEQDSGASRTNHVAVLAWKERGNARTCLGSMVGLPLSLVPIWRSCARALIIYLVSLLFVSKLIDIISRFGDSVFYAMTQWRKRIKQSFQKAYSSLL
jgi:hypothetical protein